MSLSALLALVVDELFRVVLLAPEPVELLVAEPVELLVAEPVELLLELVFSAALFLAVVLGFVALLCLAGLLFAACCLAAELDVDGVEAAGPDPVDSFTGSSPVAEFSAAVLSTVDVFAPESSALLGGSFSPETTARSSDPARNLGTAVSVDVLCSPVRGLRTARAGRMTFSKAPNPVSATFSPLATSLVIVSSTDSRAC